MIPSKGGRGKDPQESSDYASRRRYQVTVSGKSSGETEDSKGI